MDEAVGLQMLHPLADVQADAQQGPQAEAALPLPEEVEQTAVLHELGHDVDGLLLAANSVQLHQFGVRQVPGRNTSYYSEPEVSNDGGGETPQHRRRIEGYAAACGLTRP